MEYFFINLSVSIIFLYLLLGKEMKEKRMIYYTIGFFFIILIGLKGNDDEYTRLFLRIPTLPLFFSDMEVAIRNGIVFAFIGSFLKTLNFNSQGLLFFFSFTSILIHMKFYRIFTPFYLLAFLYYLSHEVIFHEWIQIRAGLASAMVLPMIYNLQLGKKKNFYILYIISSLIHYVSILSIILLWLNRPIKIKWLFLGLCSAFIIYFSDFIAIVLANLDNFGLLPGIVKLYLGWEEYTYHASLLHPKTFQQIISSFVILLLLSTHGKIYKSTINQSIINVYIFSTILQIAFNNYAIFAFRFSGHFYSVEPILLTYIILFFRERKFLVIVSVAFCLIVSYINYGILTRLEPYNFLLKSESAQW